MSDARTCAACGSPAPQPFRMPAAEIAPDLDMRPGEPARSTLRDWIQTCRTCTAAAPDLAALPAGTAGVVATEAYGGLTTDGTEETLPFRRWALICDATGDQAEAAEAWLQGAWAADDAAEMTEAAGLRTRVAAAWANTDRTETALRRLDVLRRAGLFDEATAWAETLAGRGLDETAAAVLEFQRQRIAQRDIGRHLISRALPPPAHAPHVSHGKRDAAARQSLFGRLFGR